MLYVNIMIIMPPLLQSAIYVAVIRVSRDTASVAISRTEASSSAAPYLVAWSRDPYPQQTETSCP